MKKSIAKILIRMSPARLIRDVRAIAAEKKASFSCIFADVVYCGLIYGAGPCDYRTFNFYGKTQAQRASYITRGVNNALVRKYNEVAYADCLNDKSKLNAIFVTYLKRAWYATETLTPEQLDDLCERSPNIIYKPLHGMQGNGVRCIDTRITDRMQLFSALRDGAAGVIEEYVQQAPEMDTLFSKSVNTLRVVTIHAEGKCVPVAVFLRMGTGNRCVDNLHHGGIAARVSLNNSRIECPAGDANGNSYAVHPDTGTKIVGFVVPRLREAIDLCCAASAEIPHLRYIGWDVAICTDGVKLIEANGFPSHDLMQLPAFCTDGMGIRAEFERFL